MERVVRRVADSILLSEGREGFTIHELPSSFGSRARRTLVGSLPGPVLVVFVRIAYPRRFRAKIPTSTRAATVRVARLIASPTSGAESNGRSL